MLVGELSTEVGRLFNLTGVRDVLPFKGRRAA